MTPEAKDLIESLLKSNENERITKRGSDKMRKHPFFAGIDWDNLRTKSAPIIPHTTPEESLTLRNFNENEKKNPFFQASSEKSLNKSEVYSLFIFELKRN